MIRLCGIHVGVDNDPRFNNYILHSPELPFPPCGPGSNARTNRQKTSRRYRTPGVLAVLERHHALPSQGHMLPLREFDSARHSPKRAEVKLFRIIKFLVLNPTGGHT
jgi:hypothetical protein